MIKRKRFLENSDDMADQIMVRNDDNALGIPKANLELKRWSYDHDLFQFGSVINY